MPAGLIFRRLRVPRMTCAPLLPYISMRAASSAHPHESSTVSLPCPDELPLPPPLSPPLPTPTPTPTHPISAGDSAVPAVERLRAALDPPVRRDEVVTALVQLLEKDSELGARLLTALPGDTLRVMLVIGTAQEYFGRDSVEAQLRSVDKDHDDSISSQEYDEWVVSTIRNHTSRDLSIKPLPSQSSTVSSPPVQEAENSQRIPHRLWRRVVLSAAVPFMAFGMLDNAVFVTTGDAIDKSVADIFGLSTMAAAALGGVVSGAAGIQVHGLVDRMAQQTPFAQPPRLTAAQKESLTYKNATRLGNTLGMVFGLFVGMAPLLVLSHSGA